MAAAKKATKGAKAKPATGTDIVKWDEELAKYADQSAATEASTGSGLQSFSLRSGVLSIDDNAMPNNEMAVIVLDSILENVFYLEDYDPDNPVPPSAYALGRDEDTMRWSDDSIPEMETPDGMEKIAGELCNDTWINSWGSADKGRGKACRNIRRLLLIPAGTIDKKTGAFELIEDEEHYASVKPAFLKVPPTSITNWANYVKQLKASLRKPPFAIATRIKVVPDGKSQFKVTFEALEEVPEALLGVMLKRHKEAEELIMQPYDLSERDEPREKPARGRNAKAPAKKAAKKATGKKRY